ncbi:hypothetical protein HOLleu_01352 [Holothuria leucospilota]|uniref:Uncharacterized protein n=1 Tax=Holothuria leucospilota TaxID=206669 RepID=A0A9Q1HGD2_HOLLE|nr:hypothetical protein HOLleu_01352 [Holothuria leucospilota]
MCSTLLDETFYNCLLPQFIPPECLSVLKERAVRGKVNSGPPGVGICHLLLQVLPL